MRRSHDHGGRNASSGVRSTPDRSPYFPSSTSSDASTVKKRNPAAAAARSVAGVFVACFTPPETTSSSNYGDSSDAHKPPSASSSTSTPNGDRRRSGSKRGIYGSPHGSVHRTEPQSLRFTMQEIYKATRNFSPSLKIGQGGFGTVYKGRLEDGTLVAIKRAKKSVYDKHLNVEFQSEIRTLAQVEHLNLVRFCGFVEHEDERVVVEEFVPNGTLREHLDCIHGTVLDLGVRLDVAIDVAHAVTYLHMYTDHPIIHRDIKSSNILLTDTLRAKVADFGFARLAADSETGATHISTQVKGTAGYLDPEYLRTYQLTEKSDVFSFGVLLVELVTGRRPIEPKRELKERVTTRWAFNKCESHGAIFTLDPKLERTSANNLAVEKILELAWRCAANRRQDRPSMQKCAEILWNIRKDYKDLLASSAHFQLSRSKRVAVIREE